MLVGLVREATHVVPLDVLLRYMVGRLSVLGIEQARNDPAVMGNAPALSDADRWFECEIVAT
jgi:hypothetical protein